MGLGARIFAKNRMFLQDLQNLDPESLRAWCDTLSRGLKHQTINRNGAPYLTRYFAAGWNPWNRAAAGAAVYLHHFAASDPPGAVHSHPWKWSASLILVGGYREFRCTGGQAIARDFVPGDVNLLPPSATHRIELLGADCWTLFIVGPYLQDWAFYPECNHGQLE